MGGFGHDVNAVCRSSNRLNLGRHGTLGETHHGRCVINGDSFAELFPQSLSIARCGNADARDNLQDGEIPHAMVAGAIGACHTGAVQHKRHSSVMQRDIHEDLIESSVDKGRIDGNNGVHSAIGETCSARHGVLLGDPYIQHTIGILCRHLMKTCGAQHGSSDTDNFVVAIGEGHHLLGEHLGPGHRVGGFSGLTSQRVNLSHRVELVCLIIPSRCITTTFFRNHMDDYRSAAIFSLLQDSLNIVDAVPIYRT